MQSYDDINSFKLKTGVENYKILSEHNADNALAKWSVIEKINGLPVTDAIIPLVAGTSEFNHITVAELAFPEPINPPIVQKPALPEIIPAKALTVSDRALTVSDNEETRFASLFKSKSTAPVEIQPLQPQRELSLSTLFERIAACQ